MLLKFTIKISIKKIPSLATLEKQFSLNSSFSEHFSDKTLLGDCFCNLLITVVDSTKIR